MKFRLTAAVIGVGIALAVVSGAFAAHKYLITYCA